MVLDVPIGLNALALLSAALLLLGHGRDATGRVKLPTTEDDDPFHITSQIDVVDGFPLGEEEFWARMKTRKRLLVAVSFLCVAIQTGTILSNGTGHPRVLRLTFDFYLLAISLVSVSRQTTSGHGAAIWHLFVLSFVMTASLGFLLLQPDNSAVEALPARLAIFLGHVLLSLLSGTTRCGPSLYFPRNALYAKPGHSPEPEGAEKNENVSGIAGASPLQAIFFSYTTRVLLLGLAAKERNLELTDLPVLPGNMRASVLYTGLRHSLRAQPAGLLWHLICLNARSLLLVVVFSCADGVLFMISSVFLQRILAYLERARTQAAPDSDVRNGLIWVAALFVTNVLLFTLLGQIWGLSTASLRARVRNQLNTVLFAKMLARKDVASPSPEERIREDEAAANGTESKAQVMTLMTTDVDRVATLTHQLFCVIDVPIALTLGTAILYSFLGSSAFVGLAATVLCLPLNHVATRVVSRTQEGLMKARDERVGLTNEVLASIRMLKFLVWERTFEQKVGEKREKEIGLLRLGYLIETMLWVLWNGVPVAIAFFSFFHFSVIRGEDLTPSLAFASLLVLNEIRWALNGGVNTIISMLQGLVSLRRIETYLDGEEVAFVPRLPSVAEDITLQSCSMTWPESRRCSPTSAPRGKFILADLNLTFPRGELSLICGRLGSGKSLLLLGLLGEADILGGHLTCLRSPATFLADCVGREIKPADWVVEGRVAYVPQVAWLQNASIKENILFNLPLDEVRYHQTLEACALLDDLDVLEDGDDSEIGERGVTLSGGQKARVSLARAVYSRASILLLDDVLSAVDAQTAKHLYHACLRGQLLRDRTVILVSHHIQLCVPGSRYVVALDNGRLSFAGSARDFEGSETMAGLVHNFSVVDSTDEAEKPVDDIPSLDGKRVEPRVRAHTPKKLVEDEYRAQGRVQFSVWSTYLRACGSWGFWACFLALSVLAALARVAGNAWLGYWTSGKSSGDALYNVRIYSGIAVVGLVIGTARMLVLCKSFCALWSVSIDLTLRDQIPGDFVARKLSIHLLEAILFARLRFHDVVSRGRVLNRFGKDLEVIDSSLPNNLSATTAAIMSLVTAITTFCIVGGLPFVLGICVMMFVYYYVAKPYGHTARELRRLESTTRSPLYSIYSETMSGVVVVRAFGAPSLFLREMIRHVDVNCNPSYWTWAISSWLQVRLLCLGAVIVAFLGILCITNKNISAPTAGFALSFADTMTDGLLYFLREFVNLEQALVAVERVTEFSAIQQEPHSQKDGGVERLATSWPSKGEIVCTDLSVRYAPGLPEVLHNLAFHIRPGEKIGIIGRTGSGKSTLALALLRLLDPECTSGRIHIDGRNIESIELSTLRRGIRRGSHNFERYSSLHAQCVGEYQDEEIFGALRRVHLIPSSYPETQVTDLENANVFRNLETPVHEGGHNFSAGEKQLLCMARAILRRSKILIMDEATASVDYTTDQLIGQTIREEFHDSTILTIAHRLRSIIDYDKIMLLDNGTLWVFLPAGTAPNQFNIVNVAASTSFLGFSAGVTGAKTIRTQTTGNTAPTT
ncbi:Multidrug resistance-associated ABC transporter protein [Mycena kentingensis (nom. inval.)]|nr:Multidrug resistance-associated ABC transporter protein [Mycena kentingensis (nom. inval.)]